MPGALIICLFSWLIFGLTLGLRGLIFGLILVLLFGLTFGLIDSLSRKQTTERLQLSPNEGIQRSLKNGLVVGLICSLFIGLIFRLGSSIAPSSGLGSNLAFWLISGLIIWLIFGLSFGIGAYLQHFVLRIFLWRTNCLPWRLIPFLDEAAERLLLRKVGGSYIFVHRLLLEYFATLETSSSEEVSTGSVLLQQADEKE